MDPGTLQPALNPQFAPWSCWTAGNGITCQGDYSDSWSEPLDLGCEGQLVYSAGTRSEEMTRWHTSDRLTTKTVQQIHHHGNSA